jgi:adenylylsulfate kinase
MAKKIIGQEDFFEVYVECSFKTCKERDVKGLYAKAKTGQVKQFTGMDSSFEPPEPRALADLILNTNTQTECESFQQLYEAVRPRVFLEK